ncbi:hypothetical protein GCM10010218_22830 [Streptomyces mashuensis]|uniref:DUF397 domain-containing protein n=2 Tax=Streptomyces mashuensis TaxID=33904 RepID=A0A919B2M0_9ACTN|nr:hypothetical protein GCM10010218_22830 [Streptomyces mashuensis]
MEGMSVARARAVPSGARWRKSRHSSGTGGQCVEVADNIPGTVPIRDSKRPATHITVPPTAWAAFTSALRATGKP